MCQDKGKYALSDEVWEAGSTEGDSGSESECESVADAAPPPRRPKAGAGTPKAVPPLASLAVVAPKKTVSPAPLDPARQMAMQVTGNAQAGGLMALVSHLRADNTRLREALVAAQRETEALIAAQQQQQEAHEEQQAEAAAAAGGSGGVDFGHLLELVRDFGADGLGGSEEDYLVEDASTDVEVFTISSARGEKSSVDEAASLREELEASRLEVARLRAELAARDSLRQAAAPAA